MPHENRPVCRRCLDRVDAVCTGFRVVHHLDGVKIHYLTMGSSGSWVVLIHGYTDTAERMWFKTGIAPALAKRHRVVALDNRNHGQSDSRCRMVPAARRTSSS